MCTVYSFSAEQLELMEFKGLGDHGDASFGRSLAPSPPFQLNLHYGESVALPSTATPDRKTKGHSFRSITSAMDGVRKCIARLFAVLKG
jgi:hypothetical protein